MKHAKGYWTKEQCHQEALKYKYNKDFQKNSHNAYLIAYRNNWLDDIRTHMTKLGDKFQRCIYAIEFTDNHVYIGLTFDIEQRFSQHLNNSNSSVFKHIQLTGLTPIIKQLSDYIDIENATNLEIEKVNEYSNNNWVILNKIKAGGIGKSDVKWTKEKCHEVALKYNTRSEFQVQDKNVYCRVQHNGWLDELCSHMTELIKIKGYWTKEKCFEEALKYKTRRSFSKTNGSAYNAARKNGWIDEICSHMKINHFKKFRNATNQ